MTIPAMDRAPLGQVVSPGQVLFKMPEQGDVRVGPGLQVEDGCLITTRSGLLRKTKAGKFWVEGRAKRYLPSVDSQVIGIITEKHSENFIVNIRGPGPALLPVLSFEGATRRNRPNLQVGDLVLCRIVSTQRDLEPVLSCVDGSNKAAGMGPLKEGTLITVSTQYARALQAQPPAPVLAALARHLHFELAVGLNGWVWLAAESVTRVVLAANAVQHAEFLTAAQAATLVARLVQAEKASAGVAGE